MLNIIANAESSKIYVKNFLIPSISKNKEFRKISNFYDFSGVWKKSNDFVIFMICIILYVTIFYYEFMTLIILFKINCLFM
jgi:hypothetical protein